MLDYLKDSVTWLLKKVFEYVVVALAVFGGYGIYVQYGDEITSAQDQAKDMAREELKKVINGD